MKNVSTVTANTLVNKTGFYIEYNHAWREVYTSCQSGCKVIFTLIMNGKYVDVAFNALKDVKISGFPKY